MKTMYEKTKCGIEIAGFGKQDLKGNLENHEANCAACKTHNEVIVAVEAKPVEKVVVKQVVKKVVVTKKDKASFVSKAKKLLNKKKK